MADIPDPQITYDEHTRVVTIDGHHFSRDLFSHITASPLGVRFRVIAREDGIITLSTETDPLAQEVLAMLREASVRIDCPVLIERIEALIARAAGGGHD